MPADEKDPYVNSIRRHARREKDEYFLDRLLIGAVIEARGAERFSLIASAPVEADIQAFYQTLANSEANHYKLFIDLANHYFDSERVIPRLDDWLRIEADVLANLPVLPRLH